MPSSSFALPMAIFLVLLVFLVAATLGTSIGRGVFEFLNKYMPENIGVNWQSTTDDSISDYSANAVACAAYSVGKGAELSCVSSVYTKPSGIGGGKQTVYDYSAPSDSFSMASSVSGFAAADTSIDTSTIQPSKKSWVTCEYDATYTNMESCTVHNFRMPQYIDSVEKDKWIPLHGDPEYLLYWNLYPPEEDTWTYDGPGWKMNVAIGIISVLPVGKVFSLGTRLARSAAAKAIPALAPSAMKSAFEKEAEKVLIKTYGADWAEKIGEKGLEDATKNVIQKQSISSLMRAAAKGSLYEMIKDRLSAKGLTSVATRAGVLKGALAIAEALSESMMDRLTPQGPVISIKKDYAKPEKLDELNSPNIPILVKWTPETSEILKPFHLASPCYLNEIKFEKSDVVCSSYIRYDDEGASGGTPNSLCDCSSGKCSLTSSSDDYMKCGVFDITVENSFYKGSYNFLSWLSKKSDKRIVEMTKDSSDRVTDVKIYLPWNDFYISSIKLESGTSMWDVGNPRHYSAELYKKSDNTKSGDVKIRCPTDEAKRCVATIDDSNGDFLFEVILSNNDDKTRTFVYNNAEFSFHEVGSSMTIYTQASSGMGTFTYVSFTDDDFDGKYDSISMQKLGRTLSIYSADIEDEQSDTKASITLSEMDAQGKPAYINMAGCTTPAIVADLNNLGNKKMSESESGYKYNYCMQYTSSGKIAFKWIGRAAGTVGIAASVLLTGGWAAVVIVGGAAIETSAEITNNYAPLWPDSG